MDKRKVLDRLYIIRGTVISMENELRWLRKWLDRLEEELKGEA